MPVRSLAAVSSRAIPEKHPGIPVKSPPEQILWAVRTAAQYVPGTQNCLVQAVAARRLLARRGHAADLCLGVRKTGAGQFEGHAWVEHEGKPLPGEAASRFAILLKMPGCNLNADEGVMICSAAP
jgi:hypothetical protein